MSDATENVGAEFERLAEHIRADVIVAVAAHHDAAMALADPTERWLVMSAGVMAAFCEMMANRGVQSDDDAAIAEWASEFVLANMPEARRKLQLIASRCEGSA